MSRIGRLPIKIPAGVTVSFENGVATVKGPLGALTMDMDKRINLETKDGEIHLTRADDNKNTKALHGLYRATLANMVEGVTKGFEKHLMVAGVGVKVALQGTKLVMNIGFSHPVEVEQPKGITFAVVNTTPNLVEIAVKGIDKIEVGQCAATIKAIKKVEPYHGYGIYYKDEVVVRKEGKTAGK